MHLDAISGMGYPTAVVDIESQLRAAAHNSGLSIKRLSVQSGVPYAVCHGFFNGEGINLTTAAKLAAFLGLELRAVKRKVSHAQKTSTVARNR